MSKEEVFNEKISLRQQNDPKIREYVEWAQKNGVIMDKLQFPAAFGPDHSIVMGSAAKTDIEYNEAFVYVPNRCLITVERARSSDIGFMFDNHDNLFKSNPDRDFLTILTFLMFEFQKGEGSFWHPYFQAVDPGELTCYWDDKYINSLSDHELKEQIKAYRESMEEEWDQIQKVMRVYPDYFDLGVCNYDMFQKAACFIATRCFGWGLPTTILVPIADSFNHSSKSGNMIDFVNKRLHLMQNKIYAYQFNFDVDSSSTGIDDQYDKSTSKFKYNIKRLFKEDQDIISDQDKVKLVAGDMPTKEELNDRYDEQEVFERFKSLLKSEVNNEDEDETEEHKKEKFPNHGMELWGIGYVSSDHEQDDDEDGEEEDAEEAAMNEELKRKILHDKGAPEDFGMDEFETISSNTRLREIYSYRWWQDNDADNYFVMVNKNLKTIKAGEQIYYNYGRRTNAYLLENYGFVLDENNQYNSLQFRVIIGTNPKEQINLAQDLLPDQKILEDRENIDTTTEVMKVKPFRVSEGLFAYLRSVLQNNYNGADSQYLMVSSPRVIEYELIIVDYAIDILECYGKRDLFKYHTLEEETKLFEQEQDYKMRFVHQHNIQRMKIYHNHMKLLKVLKAILELLQVEQDTFTRATLVRIQGVEDNDSDYELFKRRMGMRNYFKELKMNIQRIKRSKGEKQKTKEFKEEKKKQAKEPKTGDDSQMKTTTSSMKTTKSVVKKKKKC